MHIEHGASRAMRRDVPAGTCTPPSSMESPGSELVPYAHLAALAIEYGLALQTTDRDFARFSGLRWENPISH